MSLPKDPEKRAAWIQNQREKHKGQIPWSAGKTGIFSEETLRKMSESRKGNKNPFFGKTHSAKTREKYSETRRGEGNQMYGKHHSEEAKRKMSESHSGEKNPNWGKHLPEIIRRKISEANKGEKNWNYGKSTPDEVKEKIRQATLGNKNHFFGQHHSAETKQRLSEANSGEKNGNFGKHLSKERRKKLSTALKGRVVSEETRRKLSKAKLGKYSGPESPNWKGGVTSLYELIRKSAMYKLWRQAVFHKDRFQCQYCGKLSTGDFRAHHIYPFSQLLEDFDITSVGQAIRTEELWDINNGITACRDCHAKLHPKISNWVGSRKNCTRNDAGMKEPDFATETENSFSNRH